MMNRQTKRMMERQGADPSAPRERQRPAQPAPRRERTGPAQYLGEVRGEMRKVGWPTKAEVVNSTVIVLVAVTFLTTLIFGFDWASARLVLFLFD